MIDETRQRRPVPTPTPLTQPYWEAAKRGELSIQRCTDCGEPFFYPRPYCPRCSSASVVWFTTAGRGRLHSYVIAHRAMPGFELETPYIIALVELEEGPRILTNLVGVALDPGALELDMQLVVVFEETEKGIRLPQFTPADAR